MEENIPQIKRTLDYDIFKTLKGNRDVTSINRMVQSIKSLDLTMYKPINVSEDYEIIDGQHRFAACRKLGRPIYYIQMPNELAQKAMIVLNQYQSQWRQEQFLHFHACTKKGCYKNLFDYWQEHTNLGISNIIAIFPDRWINATTIKMGKAEFGKNPHCEDIVYFLQNTNVKDLPAKIKNSRPFVVAVRHAFEMYDTRQLKKLASNALKIPRCAEYKQYLDVFRNIIKPKD